MKDNVWNPKPVEENLVTVEGLVLENNQTYYGVCWEEKEDVVKYYIRKEIKNQCEAKELATWWMLSEAGEDRELYDVNDFENCVKEYIGENVKEYIG